MLKVTLSHIGAVSLGRLLAIWSFVIGAIMLVIYSIIMIVMAVIGIAAGTDFVQTVIGIILALVMGLVGLVIFAIAMFIWGFLCAIVYNIILGVGGGIDFDLKERS